VDGSAPIDAEAGAVYGTGTIFAAPILVTTTANSVVIASYASRGNSVTTWSAPTGTVTRASLNNGQTRSGIGVDLVVSAPGATPSLTAAETRFGSKRSPAWDEHVTRGW
jgi:hypothetical protein